MPRISEVISELGIDKAKFAEVYEKVVGSPLKAKAATISEKNLEDIKKELSGSKPAVKVVSASKKVIKANDFQDKTGFLSGLGFSMEAPVEEEVEEEEKADIKSDFDILKEQTVQERKEKEGKSTGGFFFDRKKPVYKTSAYSSEELGEKKSQPANKTNTGFVKLQKTGGNVSISKAKYNDKKKNKGRSQPVQVERKAVSTPAAVKKEKKQTTSQNLIKKAEIILEKNISVKEFSEKMGVELPELMKVLLKNQIMVGINSALDFDTASLVAEELGIVVKRPEAKLDVESYLSGDLQAILDLDKEATNLENRAPIVTVMGHVDHGKTSLLDYLRKTSVADGEAGGITQGIGASVVDYDGKKIAFIDTPGHELFTSLRARGAKLTNIVIIVVAADDGVMPQTIESINHAKAAGVPVVIAITKIDKAGKDPEKIKADIAAHGLTPEDWGGDTPIVPISAKTGQGIPDLLEAVLLQSEMLELKYNSKRSAVGVVLDAYKDPKQGVVTSIIVMTGSLKIRDIAVAYNTHGKIRRMWNRLGKDVSVVKGGEPVQVLGFTELPEPGRIVEIVASEKEAMNKISLLQANEEKDSEQSVMQQFLNQLKKADSSEMSVLRVVLKSDGSSSLEAMKQAVQGIELPNNVELKIVHSDVGHFSDSDLGLAQASKALLLGFNISINSAFKKKAQALGVEVKNYDIIYELTEYLEQLTQGMIEIEQEEVVVGKLDVLGVFFRKGKDMVIGGKVLEGKILNGIDFRVLRGEEIFAKGNVASLQKDKQNVKEVGEGHECGMKVKVGKKIEEGDILEFYMMQDKVA